MIFSLSVKNLNGHDKNLTDNEKIIFRNLERSTLKLEKNKSHLMFNETCYNNNEINVYNLFQVCELIETLDKYEELPMGAVSEDFLQNEIPFVVADAMTDWPVMTSDNFYFDNITDVSKKIIIEELWV